VYARTSPFAGGVGETFILDKPGTAVLVVEVPPVFAVDLFTAEIENAPLAVATPDAPNMSGVIRRPMAPVMVNTSVPEATIASAETEAQ